MTFQIGQPISCSKTLHITRRNSKGTIVEKPPYTRIGKYMGTRNGKALVEFRTSLGNQIVPVPLEDCKPMKEGESA